MEEIIMQEMQLGVIEAKFADMIWAYEPVTSSELVKLSAVEFNWKRTTTHTVIRRLCDKGLFRNDNGVIRTVISRQDFYDIIPTKYSLTLCHPMELNQKNFQLKTGKSTGSPQVPITDK